MWSLIMVAMITTIIMNVAILYGMVVDNHTVNSSYFNSTYSYIQCSGHRSMLARVSKPKTNNMQSVTTIDTVHG